MNINSLATIKNEKSISKIQYGKYLAESTFKDMFSLNEIINPLLNKDYYYKVNEPLKLKQKENLYFSNAYDDLLSSNRDVVMEKGHIYKFKAYKITYNNLKDIQGQDKNEIIKNMYENKILLEIIDLYDYLKDEMLPNSGDYSSEIGAKIYYIVLDNEEELEKFMNKIMTLRASKEALNNALATSRQNIKENALKEKEEWTSLIGSGYKSFKLDTDAYESFNKFKYENNYTEDLKTFLKNAKEDEIKKVIPELINTEGNLVKDRVGCFTNLYEDIDKNKNYYKLLKDAVESKTKEYVCNFNSKAAKEESYENLKTKALYIAKDNLDEYILSSLKSRIIKKYSSYTDKKTSMLTKNGIDVFENISKNEYIKYLKVDELKSKLLKDEDFENIKENLYYLNDNSSKEKLKIFLLEKFKFPEENVKLFIDNILNNEYYSAKNKEDISKTIKFIDDKGYIFITYTDYFNKLEDDLLKCTKYKQTAFEEIEEYMNMYSLIFNLEEIEELNNLEALRKIFGEKDKLINLKEELEKANAIAAKINGMSKEEYRDMLKDMKDEANLIFKYYGHDLQEEEINYKSLEAIERAVEDINNKTGYKHESLKSIAKRYLKDMFKNENFIYKMEQASNINIALAAQDHASKYEEINLNEKDSNENHERIYENRLKKAEIKDISIKDAVTYKEYILPYDMSEIFSDTVIEEGKEKRVNAYKINIEKLQLENPLYKDLFSKDMKGTYIYKTLSHNYEPKEYAHKSKIKSEISEIIIPAFKAEALVGDFKDNLVNLKKTSADLINVLYELDKCNYEINVPVKENKYKSVLKVKAQKKLKDYYKALIYEMNDSNGYFKNSLKVEIENSASLKLSTEAPIAENKAKKSLEGGKLNEDEIKSLNISETADYKEDIKDNKAIYHVNTKDIFGEDYKLAYESIGKQLVTDNIDKSPEFYNYMKENFIKDIENISEIKEKTLLESIGKGYLKKFGINSIVLSHLEKISPLVHFVKTCVNEKVPKGYFQVGSGTWNKFQVKNQKIKVFFEGIRKSTNGKYFLRPKEETKDIADMIKLLENDDYQEQINGKSFDISEDSHYKVDQNDSHINNDANIMQELLIKQRNKVYDYNYCLNKGKSSYLERNEASKLNKNMNTFMSIFESELEDNLNNEPQDNLKNMPEDIKVNINSDHIKQKLKISDAYINNINALCNLKNSPEDRSKAFKEFKEDAFSLALKQGSNVSINDVFMDLKKVIEDPKSNALINEKFYEKGIFPEGEGNKVPLYKKMDSISEKAIGKVKFEEKGIFNEVYSRNYGENAPYIDGKKVLRGDRIYSFNIDDAGLFKVLETYRNKKGNAELKLKDIQRKHVKKFQEKSFADISRNVKHYKIALPEETDETVLNKIKAQIKNEYINILPKSFEILDKIFNRSSLEDNPIHIKAFKEIRGEYDKANVTDYVTTMQVLKNKKLITKEEMNQVSEKINEQLKVGASKEEYKENLYNLLKKSSKFKERSIDTIPKVDNFLKTIITKESIENAKILKVVKKEKQYPRINIREAKGILKEQAKSIIKKADSLQHPGKKVVKSYINYLKQEDKNNEKILNSIYRENSYNHEFLNKALNIKDASNEDLESIKKVKIGYGKYAGLSIGELNNKSLSEILRKDYSDELDYKVNKQLIKKTKAVIYNAKRLNKDGIINKEAKNLTKEKLKVFLGDTYISEMENTINEVIKEKGVQNSRRYKKASNSVKAAFENKSKNTNKVLDINKPLNAGKMVSSKNLNGKFEPNIIAKPKENINKASEPINMVDANYENIPRSNTRYYAEQKIGNAINISAKSPSNSTKSDMSQLISKAVGGKHLNINTNFMDSRRKVTPAEINSMIENSIK
ncbi:hypothetical protein [Clostridium saccharoperbutylacetonicum]